MKRLIFILSFALIAISSLQAKQVSEADARQVANRFFAQKSARFTAQSGSVSPRLAYTAERGRFYVYDRGERNGFVVVAGDDRLPQVLGYGGTGDFSASTLPPAVKYWMEQMNSQIAYLQAHGDIKAHRPAKRETTVDPMVTTQWNQSEPYNNYCPTYPLSNGNEVHSASGCVATATTQLMGYYKWPNVGRGSHSYICNVNGSVLTELSADFEHTTYRWDLMLDTYDSNSSEEACDAIARLMVDVGISMDMNYGESSGASENAASNALSTYFFYTDRHYWLQRDCYSAEQWDQLLVNEISLMHPVMYCGYSTDAGHAFVLDGFDADGYFHVNWGWGGAYDGYFLFSLLNPGGTNFKYYQDAVFGLVPEAQADEVDDYMAIHGQLLPEAPSAPLGTQIRLNMDNVMVEGNMLDTVGYHQWGEGHKRYYTVIPLLLGLYDKDGVERARTEYSHELYLDDTWYGSGRSLNFELPGSLEDGEYKFKLFYSMDDGVTYDRHVLDYSGVDAYVKVIVRDDTAYLRDCFLYNTYGVESFDVPRGVRINETFNVGVNMFYDVPWTNEDGPTGNIYLSLLKDGEEVVSSEMYEVMLHANEAKTYEIQLTAPSEWGFYDVVLCDESGNRISWMYGWFSGDEPPSAPICILPICQELYDDFESMPKNNSTNSQNVQGNFTTWNFLNSGVRAPGEGKCNGAHSVMLKLPSAVYTAQPLSRNFFMAQAMFFNSSATDAKYTLEYSTDGGTSWELAQTINGEDEVEVIKKRQALVTWYLNLTDTQPAQFRIVMVGGGNGATYVDDVSLYYTELVGDVNGDGEVNIADVNAVIRMILTDETSAAGDVNGDGEINISDVNAIIGIILGN